MSIELIGIIVSNVVALVAAGIAVYSQKKSTLLEAKLEELRIAEQRRFEHEKTVAKFREPLARAAYDLQSRLYNILEMRLIETYVANGTERTRSYVVDNTTFLIAQYFAWTEIIRKEIQFLDLGKEEETRELAGLQDGIYSCWNNDSLGQALRIFAGEQRAIGESLIVEGPRGSECIGYGKFLRTLKVNKNPLVEAVRLDVTQLRNDLEDARPRLIELQNSLIDLLQFLDPKYVRFPEYSRQKVEPAKQNDADTPDASGSAAAPVAARD
jgi:hypothetical protein